MQEILLKKRYFERALSKTFKKVNIIFFSQPSSNVQSYEKQKGPGTSDPSLFSLQKSSEKFLYWVSVFPAPRPFAWPPALALAPDLYLLALDLDLCLPTLAPNLCLPALAPNLYLTALAPNMCLPALVPNLCLAALVSDLLFTSSGQDFTTTTTTATCTNTTTTITITTTTTTT